MAKSYKKKRKNNAPTILAASGLGLLSIALLAGFVWMWARSSETVVLDARNCPVKDGPASVTALLIDTTDPVTDTTLSDIRNEFRKAISAVGVGGYVLIVKLTATPGDIPELFGRCNPGDRSSVDGLTNNPERQQQIFEKEFDGPLEKLADQFPNGTSADKSPIMAAIQKVKLTLFDGERAGTGPKKLIIVSDMIEHTGDYSQYRSGLDQEKYEASLARRKYNTTLDGVEVKILYIDRANRPFKSYDHKVFWKRWIEEHGGSFGGVVGLEGLN